MINKILELVKNGDKCVEFICRPYSYFRAYYIKVGDYYIDDLISMDEYNLIIKEKHDREAKFSHEEKKDRLNKVMEFLNGK